MHLLWTLYWFPVAKWSLSLRTQHWKFDHRHSEQWTVPAVSHTVSICYIIFIHLYLIHKCESGWATSWTVSGPSQGQIKCPVNLIQHVWTKGGSKSTCSWPGSNWFQVCSLCYIFLFSVTVFLRTDTSLIKHVRPTQHVSWGVKHGACSTEVQTIIYSYLLNGNSWKNLPPISPLSAPPIYALISPCLPASLPPSSCHPHWPGLDYRCSKLSPYIPSFPLPVPLQCCSAWINSQGSCTAVTH